MTAQEVGALTAADTESLTYGAAVASEPTGRFVYVTSSNGVSSFSVNGTTGVTTSLGANFHPVGGTYNAIVASP